MYGGNQALPFFYDNTAAAFSEAVRTFDAPRDFLQNSLVGLVLWLQGQPAAIGSASFDAASQSYVLTGAGEEIGGIRDEFHYAFKQITGAGSITVKVDSLTNTNSWTRAGIMFRDSLDPDSPFAMVAVTPKKRATFEFRQLAGQNSSVSSSCWVMVRLP